MRRLTRGAGGAAGDPPASRWTVIWIVLALAAASGCTTSITQIPTLPPLEDAPHGDPSRDAQERLLTEAHRAFAQARYPTAVLFFARYIERAPDSARIAEARWWLGLAHEELGEDRAAMEQYRVIVAGEPTAMPQRNGALYEAQALRRLDELRQRHPVPQTAARHVALRLEAGPTLSMPPDRLQEWAAAGVTALIVGPLSLPATEEDLRLLAAFAEKAHRSRLLVWPAIDLHASSGDQLKAEWIAGAAGLDVAHDGYQMWVEAVVAQVLASGCDGLFVQARASPGFAAAASADSARAFAAAFGTDASPQTFLSQDASGLAGDKAPLYWRWVGWKSTAYGRFIGRLSQQVRKSRPSGTVLLEVHEAALRDPLLGLEQYGENLLDLKGRPGVSIVVRAEAIGSRTGYDRASEFRGDDRLWLEVWRPANGESPSGEAVRSWLAALPGNPAIVVVPASVPAVP